MKPSRYKRKEWVLGDGGLYEVFASGEVHAHASNHSEAIITRFWRLQEDYPATTRDDLSRIQAILNRLRE